MRIALLVCVCAITGCASTPSGPATTYVSASGKPLDIAPVRADNTLDGKALAEARKAGYKLVNTNGELLYCRTDMKLGTHIQRSSDTICLTAQEITTMHEQTRHSLEQFVPVHLCGGPSPAPPC
jgi:hypothetical protein